ncbi:hypothetical protein OHA74_12885 [Streptomyces phaeochromogenes]|uniref:hypothetical protein n=1 Tax=Streptomyces phaeochromogenes TaxID=1923 RepID=UPI002E2ACF4A|nr:hypothetical protein [Streptomyces phaeochromogenes]
MARTGAVLLVLLAALVHVLACAHGPASTPAGQTDTLLLTSSASCGQTPEGPQQTTARQTGPAHNSGVHCWGMDAPTAQPPRDVTLTAPAVHIAPSAGHLGAPPPPVPPALQPSLPAPGVSSAGQTRSRIGVWRT